MTNAKTSVQGMWRSRLSFILAAVGSAVGLGNIWKFPYITGEYGGGAFVIVYLICICLVGIPIMVAEILLGRRGRQNPIQSVATVAQESGKSRAWGGVGALGVLSGFLVLSFYSVIAGWAVAYTGYLATGMFNEQTAEFAGTQFSSLLASPWSLIGWHTLFMALVAIVVARGVRKGLEASLRIMMPLLFAILLVLVGYSMSLGAFGEGMNFLFHFDWSKLSSEAVIVALGHSFFTLSLGLGCILAYGAYMPQDASIGKTVFVIAGLDTLIALLAGMAIFPIVFANGMDPAAGPGLLFQTLPISFGHMPAGAFFGALFFGLVVVAAWSSSISLLEPVVAWLNETKGMSRVTAALLSAGVVWFLGIGTVLSFNLWSEYTLYDRTFFDWLDFITSNIMLPTAGLLAAIFVGWFMQERFARAEVLENPARQWMYQAWRFVLRYVTPVLVLIIIGDFIRKTISG